MPLSVGNTAQGASWMQIVRRLGAKLWWSVERVGSANKKGSATLLRSSHLRESRAQAHHRACSRLCQPGTTTWPPGRPGLGARARAVGSPPPASGARTYLRHPWFLTGRQAVRGQRHWCAPCPRPSSEGSARLGRGSWSAREVQRCAPDPWQHGGSSRRRTAEGLRSWRGRQERWQLWRPPDPAPGPAPRCWLSASTAQRWLDRAGPPAEQTVAGQLTAVPRAGQLGTAGRWVRRRGARQRVVRARVARLTGLLWPPVVGVSEATAAPWAQLCERAQSAGLALEAVRGVTSAGAVGRRSYWEQAVAWVNHRRGVFHLRRPLTSELAARARAAAAGLAGAPAPAVRRRTRRELVALGRGVLAAPHLSEAEGARSPGG